jgi:glutathione synthase/RimK-type ligase-like ATP-grasp enzyme
MAILIVVDNPESWPLQLAGVGVVSARSYLGDPSLSEGRGVVVFNLCRSYSYQRLGYYVSLLAEARGHRVQPSVTTIQDLRSRPILRIVSDDMRRLIQSTLAQIRSDEFTLSIYFGEPLAKRDKRLALALFNQFQAPLLRARFTRAQKGPDRDWQLQSLVPIPASEIPLSHRPFVVEAAERFFARRTPTRRRPAPRADLAILHGSEGTEPASDELAIERFVRAADSLGFATEIITKLDYGRLAEFDALFIRETTSVNHHTFRFASRAAAEGLVVIDHPESIARCGNKVFLKEHFERYEVPSPRALIVHKDNRDRVEAELGLPCVLKQPDSSFSQGVVRADDPATLDRELDRLLEGSELILAQEWLPTDFDWRVGILDGKPLYACRYYMARRHWQILKRETGGRMVSGRVETLRVEDAPKAVVRAALKAARPIGDGLYGVDLKQLGRRAYVIEVNDNPTIDGGFEDRVLGKELYRTILQVFWDRIEARRDGRY